MNISRKKGPLYLQIKQILKDRILHGVYQIHSNLPAEPQLEKEFQVSKITVRKAIQELVQEGYLEAKSGIGTKVIRNTATSMLSKGKLFTEYLIEEGHQIQKKLLEIEILQNEENTKKYELLGKYCTCIKRVYYLNNQPYIHFTHYISPKITNINHSNLEDRSLYELIEKQDYLLERFQDFFSVSAAPSHVMKTLGLKTETSLLKRIRYSFDVMNNLIEYSVGYYNTELQEYVLNYEK
ncbi:GntR family transcriptional regulator [Cytobacillus praedii]|uniref:GntR family transcriptional regulator n=1 Tax=Cytobacillus praedii TaxID=1742358 RepID=UPI002E1AE7CB|nr:GntR family transcriptional regulator [Cytobacillus praedii]